MRLIFMLLLICTPILCQSQKHAVIGKWKAVDDVSGKQVSIIEIFENAGKIYGKVVEISNPADRSKTCTHCSGADKNKPILGLTVIKGLEKDGNEYNNGYILDPKHGKLYKCYITALSATKLKVRGYIGISFIGRTQYWHRVE